MRYRHSGCLQSEAASCLRNAKEIYTVEWCICHNSLVIIPNITGFHCNIYSVYRNKIHKKLELCVESKLYQRGRTTIHAYCCRINETKGMVTPGTLTMLNDPFIVRIW